MRICAFLTVFNPDGSDILYSTCLGGQSTDQGNEIALDSANNVYIVGSTSSDDSFPVKNSFQSVNAGGRDAFVAKFNTSLSGNASLIYSTFIGGAGTDEGFGSVDAGGLAYNPGVTGRLTSLKKLRRPSINEPLSGSQSNGTIGHSSFSAVLIKMKAENCAWQRGLIYFTGSTLQRFPPRYLFKRHKE